MPRLDFPAVEKTLSHVIARRPSTVESSEPDTPVSDYSHGHEINDRDALTLQVSRYAKPDLLRTVTRVTTASSVNRDPWFEVYW
jgi:hypothetical protein